MVALGLGSGGENNLKKKRSFLHLIKRNTRNIRGDGLAATVAQCVPVVTRTPSNDPWEERRMGRKQGKRIPTKFRALILQRETVGPWERKRVSTGKS